MKCYSCWNSINSKGLPWLFKWIAIIRIWNETRYLKMPRGQVVTSCHKFPIIGILVRNARKETSTFVYLPWKTVFVENSLLWVFFMPSTNLFSKGTAKNLIHFFNFFVRKSGCTKHEFYSSVEFNIGNPYFFSGKPATQMYPKSSDDLSC